MLGRVKAAGQGWPQLPLGGVVLSGGLRFSGGRVCLGPPPTPGQGWVLGLALGPQLLSARAESAVKEQLNKDLWSFPGGLDRSRTTAATLGDTGQGAQRDRWQQDGLCTGRHRAASTAPCPAAPSPWLPKQPKVSQGLPHPGWSLGRGWVGSGLGRGPCRPPPRGSSSPPSPPPGCPRVGQGSRPLSWVSPWGLQHTGALEGLR